MYITQDYESMDGMTFDQFLSDLMKRPEVKQLAARVPGIGLQDKRKALGDKMYEIWREVKDVLNHYAERLDQLRRDY